MLDFKKIIMPVGEIQKKLLSMDLKNRNTNNVEQCVYDIKSALESDSKNHEGTLDELMRDYANKNHLYDEPVPQKKSGAERMAEINNDPGLSRMAKDRVLRMEGLD